LTTRIKAIAFTLLGIFTVIGAGLFYDYYHMARTATIAVKSTGQATMTPMSVASASQPVVNCGTLYDYLIVNTGLRNLIGTPTMTACGTLATAENYARSVYPDGWFIVPRGVAPTLNNAIAQM